jgi:hypothetical protein
MTYTLEVAQGVSIATCMTNETRYSTVVKEQQQLQYDTSHTAAHASAATAA